MLKYVLMHTILSRSIVGENVRWVREEGLEDTEDGLDLILVEDRSVFSLLGRGQDGFSDEAHAGGSSAQAC